MTPKILRSMNNLGSDYIGGLRYISPTDQSKVQMAMVRGAVDPDDIPATARQLDIRSVPGPSTSKRKRESNAAPSSSQTRPSSSQASQPVVISGHEVIEIDDDEDEAGPVQDSRDDLYVVMASQAVGVQYYNGR